MELLPYSRQFAITNNPAWLPGWSTHRSFNRFIHLSYGLELTQSDDLRISLIGYAIDPENPSATNKEIVNELSSDTLEKASRLSGRWVLLCEFPDKEFVLQDPCGLRQVFYSDNFCASQASTAAQFYGFEIDPEAQSGFLDTEFAKTNEEYWWPGDSTQYKGVKCLLPNHYLDLKTNTVHRYGLEPIAQTQLNEAADAGASLLASLIKAASKRFRLSLPLTAGWDSRTLLAACISAGVEPYCYTLKWGDRNSSHQDLAIPPQLIKWPHHVIDCPRTASREFTEAFSTSVNPAHDAAIPMGLFRHYPDGLVSLSGHCSEVSRCFYQERDAKVTPEYLAQITGMDKTPFVLKQFEEWLDDARPESERCGMHVLDLFYWEQRAGRWAANGQAQWDICHERFTAFNHRPLINTLLSTEETFRRVPDYTLYREMIHRMAPHLLDIPINPDSQKKPSPFFRRILRKLIASGS